MFRVDTMTKKITLHKGDTGTIRCRLLDLPEEGDVKAVFTMKNKHGAIVKTGIYEPDDGEISISFLNSDTDSLDPGIYAYDVRVVVNPTYGTGGRVDDAPIVRTPAGSPYIIEILDTVGDI